MIIDTIKNQPTSYSVDKVVEELESLKDGYDHSCLDNAYERGVEVGAKWMKKKAIEIVKQGGVADDECEWKQTSTARYKTSCGYKLEEYFDTNACYCKQCGKKIKVVE